MSHLESFLNGRPPVDQDPDETYADCHTAAPDSGMSIDTNPLASKNAGRVPYFDSQAVKAHHAARGRRGGDGGYGNETPRRDPAAGGFVSSRPARPATPAYKPFPVHLLPDPLEAFVAAGAEALRVEAAFVALPALACLAGVVGNGARIVVHGSAENAAGGWTEPGLLWLMLIGESGTCKTPAGKLALAPLLDLHARRQRQLDHEEAEYAREKLEYERELSAWKHKRKAKTPDDEGAGDDGPPAEPEPPMATQHVVDDATAEALAPIQRDTPRGPLLFRDELSGWIGSMDRYAKGGAGGDLPRYLGMHTAEPYTVNRKTPDAQGRRRLFVPAGALSVYGGIQPGRMAEVFTPAVRAAGLLGRMLVAAPPRVPKRIPGPPVPADVAERWAGIVRGLDDVPVNLDVALRPVPRFVGMSREAQTRWWDWYEKHNQAAADLEGDEAAAYAKLEAHPPRLALLFALMRWSDHGGGENVVANADDLRRACALTDWFAAEARRAYSVLAEGGADRDARKLAEWVGRQAGRASTAAELARSGLRQYRGDAAAAAVALLDLAERGYGSMGHDGSRPGHPAERFVLADDSERADAGYDAGYETPPNDPDIGGFVSVSSVSTLETDHVPDALDFAEPARPVGNPLPDAVPDAGKGKRRKGGT